MSNPLVSICLPTYNYARYLPEAISSCLNQTYKHIELIIVDDASTDNSSEVIRSFDDPRIRFVVNPVRLGLVENWNKTVSLVRGEIVKFMFADDYPAENAIEKFIAPFENPAIDLVFSSSQQIDAEGKSLYIHQPYQHTREVPGHTEARRCLLEGNLIGGPTSVAIRASALREAGDFNERLRYSADVEMWIRILLDGDAYFLAEPLVSGRIHEGSETKRLERTNQIQIETRKFIQSCLRHPRIRALLSDEEQARLRAQNGTRSYWRKLQQFLKRILR